MSGCERGSAESFVLAAESEDTQAPGLGCGSAISSRDERSGAEVPTRLAPVTVPLATQLSEV